jgi:Uma2 family endonuclease
MSGGSVNHGYICGNIYAELRSYFKGKKSNCKAINSEIKLAIQNYHSYLYPDAMVVCEESTHSEDKKNALTNPTVIVEVLSKSTAAYDKGDKFILSRQIPSLKYYILIEAEKAEINVYERNSPSNNFFWGFTIVQGLDAVLTLNLSETEIITIKMSDIYLDVEFE